MKWEEESEGRNKRTEASNRGKEGYHKQKVKKEKEMEKIWGWSIITINNKRNFLRRPLDWITRLSILCWCPYWVVGHESSIGPNLQILAYLKFVQAMGWDFVARAIYSCYARYRLNSAGRVPLRTAGLILFWSKKKTCWFRSGQRICGYDRMRDGPPAHVHFGFFRLFGDFLLFD